MAKVKRGPLNKAEVFYINGNRESLSEQQMAEDLNRSIVCVRNYLESNPVNSKSGRITVGDQFTRQKGVTIMTENASSMADAKRKPVNTAGRKNCTTSVKGNE